MSPDIPQAPVRAAASHPLATVLALVPRFALLSARVLWRNRRRTLLTLSSLVVGQVVLVLSFALFAAGTRAQIEQVCHRSAGHLQVQAPGYFESQDAKRYVTHPASLEALRRLVPEIVEERPRVNLLGVLEFKKRIQYVTVKAVDPAREPPPIMVRGAPLDPAIPRMAPYPILVGTLLADHLGAGPGDLVVLSFLRSDGKPDDVQCRIKGVTEEGTPESNRMRATLPLGVGRKVLRLGEGSHQQVLFLADPDRAEAAARTLARGLGPAVSVLTWSEVNPQLRRITRLTRAHTHLVTLVVVLTSLLGIAGVLGMSVSERTREFGLFSAIGMRPGEMFLCVLLEGFILGASTVVAASLLAFGLLWILAAHGLDMTGMVGEAIVIDGVALDMVLRPRPEVVHFVGSIGLILITSLLASLWPAWRAARLDPLEAMTGRSAEEGLREGGSIPPGETARAERAPSPDGASGPIVRLDGVTRLHPGGVAALSDLSLEARAGEVVVLVGPSGSGKSTLLNLAGLLDRPTKGRIVIAGEDLTRASIEARSRFRLEATGFVFQLLNLLPAFTLRENVELPLILLGWSRRARIEREDELGRALGIAPCLDRFPHEVSGGQQQRAAVARALAARPRLVLADEPTATLDSETARTVYEMIRDLAGSSGVTVLVATHDTRLLTGRERVVRLVDGRFACEGD